MPDRKVDILDTKLGEIIGNERYTGAYAFNYSFWQRSFPHIGHCLKRGQKIVKARHWGDKWNAEVGTFSLEIETQSIKYLETQFGKPLRVYQARLFRDLDYSMIRLHSYNKFSFLFGTIWELSPIEKEPNHWLWVEFSMLFFYGRLVTSIMYAMCNVQKSTLIKICTEIDLKVFRKSYGIEQLRLLG